MIIIILDGARMRVATGIFSDSSLN